MPDSLADEPFSFGKVYNFVEALDIGMLLADNIAFPAHKYLSDGFFFGGYFRLEVVDFIVEFEDQPAKVIGMFAVDFFGFLLHNILNSGYQVLAIMLYCFHSLILLL